MSRTHRIALSAAGLTLAIASLWVGAYVLAALPSDHWAGLPTFFTAGTGVCGGFVLFIVHGAQA